VDEKEFADFVSPLDYPMFVLTLHGGPRFGRAGCLVGFATQCSIAPPRFLVCLSKKNHTFRASARARFVAVHVLRHTDRHLAELFGAQTGDDIDKFARCQWTEGPHNIPILDDCQRWFVGRIEARTDLGDHQVLTLLPVQLGGDSAAAPLMFSDVRDLDAGHGA